MTKGHGAAMSWTLAGVPSPAFCQGRLMGTGINGKPYSSLKLCLSFHTWSFLTKTQHAWLRLSFSSPRAGFLLYGARWDLTGGMVYLALRNLP